MRESGQNEFLPRDSGAKDEAVILVPADKVGLIIGKKGASIKQERIRFKY